MNIILEITHRKIVEFSLKTSTEITIFSGSALACIMLRKIQ